MHKNKLVHRDLKTENVVYAPGSSDEHEDISNIELKLIDFGFANINQRDQLNDFVGTPYYIAPEVIKQQPYGSSCDIWSLGVLTYFIIEQQFPYLGNSRKELFANVTEGKPPAFKGEVWQQVSQKCKDFILKCLTHDHAKRPSAEQLLNHAWILEKPHEDSLTHQKTLSRKISNNMATSKKANTFQWSMIQYMNQLNLNKQETENMRKMFESVDKDQNGTLAFTEIKSIMKDNLSSEDYE